MGRVYRAPKTEAPSRALDEQTLRDGVWPDFTEGSEHPLLDVVVWPDQSGVEDGGLEDVWNQASVVAMSLSAQLSEGLGN